MIKRWLLISIIGIALVLMVAACAQPTTSDPQALIEQKCSECHSADRVFNQNYSRNDWVDVFNSMIDRGANVSPDEQEIMIDWLVSRDQ